MDFESAAQRNGGQGGRQNGAVAVDDIGASCRAVIGRYARRLRIGRFAVQSQIGKPPAKCDPRHGEQKNDNRQTRTRQIQRLFVWGG